MKVATGPNGTFLRLAWSEAEGKSDRKAFFALTDRGLPAKKAIPDQLQGDTLQACQRQPRAGSHEEDFQHRRSRRDGGTEPVLEGHEASQKKPGNASYPRRSLAAYSRTFPSTPPTS